MKIIPKEETLNLKEGDVIETQDLKGRRNYFIICKSDDIRFALVNLSKSGNWDGGELTVDGVEIANLQDFVNTTDELIINLTNKGYTDIKKVTLEAREV